MPTRDKASGRGKTVSADPLSRLLAEEPPAFASDGDHRITFWNKGAEELMGRPAAQAIGRYCHDVVRGRDVFGNIFCAKVCPVTTSFGLHERVRRFELRTKGAGIPSALGFTIIQHKDETSGKSVAVHVVDEIQIDLSTRNGRQPGQREEPPLEDSRGTRGSARVADTARSSETFLSAATEPTELSQRERQVLGAVAKGMSNKDIAQLLHISVKTTRNHIQRILVKLNVHSKLEALALAFNRRLV